MLTTAQITEKLALLNSQWFMSFWKRGGEPYENLLEKYLAQDNDKEFLKLIKKEYSFNEYDLETIKVDAQHLENGESLTNERKMGESPQKKTVQQEEPEETGPHQFEVPKVSPEEHEKVDKEFKEYKPKVKEEPKEEKSAEAEEPLYETKKISAKKLSVLDIIPYKDLLWCVIKKYERNFVVIQEIYSGRTKRFDIRDEDFIDILTDESADKVVEEFKEQKLFYKLPKVLQNAY